MHMNDYFQCNELSLNGSVRWVVGVFVVTFFYQPHAHTQTIYRENETIMHYALYKKKPKNTLFNVIN